MRPSRPLAVAFAVISVALLLCVVASAHHSRAGYDSAPGKLVTNNGVVSSVIWRNPHVFVLWDVKDSKLVQLYKMAKAAVTGQPPTELGEHGEVRMK